MLEDMQLRGLSARTQEAYSRAVSQLAQHYHRRPDQLGDEELRQYFLYLTKVKKQARPTVTIALCGIKFFYQQTSNNPGPHIGSGYYATGENSQLVKGASVARPRSRFG